MNKILFSSLAVAFAFVMSAGVVSADEIQWQHVEDLNVPANADTPTTSSVPLANGTTYRVTVSGTAWACSAGNCNIEFDAEYSTSDDGATPWVDGVAAPYDGHGPDLLDLKLNGDFVDWGTYNPDHEYTQEFVSDGSPVSLMVYDVFYPNNTEALGVTIERMADGYVSGGGQIIQELDGEKSKNWYKVSFGGAVAQFGGDYVGEWEVNFHNVGENTLVVDKSKFHTTDIRNINFFPSDGGACDAAINFTAMGELDGEPGYEMVFRAGDNDDTVRITISKGGQKYDTHGGDFNDESSCVGTARTGLDRGNITIVK